ncbi:MAG TPA: MG2 domain-containing protein, partial [Acidobacteriota bacterium]|nr:MG2 domain-containing protein [Acidobacteriota bacterium]
ALYEAFDGDDNRALIKKHLADFLSDYRKYPWWAVGQALLAEYTRQEAAADALVRARKIALEGVERFPQSPGGRRCNAIVKSIEAPDYSVEATRVDATGRRSVRVTHRNLDRVFLRAYALNAEALIESSKDYSIFPQGEEARLFVEGQRPSAAWRADLPKTADYRDHHTFASLPDSLAPGLYIVAASAREDFRGDANKSLGLTVIVGDLVMIKRHGGGESGTGGGAEVVVLAGATGRPVTGATVDLYKFDWREGHSKIESKTTGADGRTSFAPRQGSGPYFLLARKDRDMVFDPDYLYLQRETPPRETRAALVYTDRSIYRPGQKIFWKVLAYKGRPDLGRVAPDTATPVTVWLEDINNQRVAQASVATNAFGTASGDFVIPAAGRPLGEWRIRTAPQGAAAVRVEEYKRPTFEVSIKDPEKPLRLNRPASLKGEARYYFGLPVTGGGRSQTVAGGRTKIDADGAFVVEFTPKADEKKGGAASGISYRYTLSADVTDEGGETRSAERSFRLGFVSVEARVLIETAFLRADAKGDFTVMRSDLNGTPKAGKGTWRVVRLAQPETTLLPADQPVVEAPGAEDPLYPPTPGDKLRPRWETIAPDTILRLWQDGREAAKGTADHDDKGAAKVAVPGLAAGAYRLLYETKDDFGAVCRDSLDFLVVGAAKAAFKLPLVVRAERPSVTVGGTARFLVEGGWGDQPLLFETFRGGVLWERRWIEAGKGDGVIEVPVTGDLRGGFGVRATAVRDHQFMSEDASVYVPWDNK